jgi:hypothetical protein
MHETDVSTSYLYHILPLTNIRPVSVASRRDFPAGFISKDIVVNPPSEHTTIYALLDENAQLSDAKNRTASYTNTPKYAISPIARVVL